MKKLFALLLTLILVLCFYGCNSNDENPKNNAPTEIIDPSTINWGYDKENNKSDRWYLQNSDDVTYISFSVDDENNCTYNLTKSGVVIESAVCVITDDNHLIPADNSLENFDLVFEDYFNAYDYTSDSYYSRGDAEEYKSYFSGRVYTQEDTLSTITFNSDLTCTKSDSDKDVSGTWAVTSTNILLCVFNSNKIEYKINYNDDLSVKSIEYDNEIYYNEIIEDETVNKYKAY